MALWIQEEFVNATKGTRYGSSEVYETGHDERGSLYRSLVREHGRCVGRIYIDKTDGRVVSIGWVFHKRKQYDDCAKTFLAETWATLHNAPPTVTRVAHYVETAR